MNRGSLHDQVSYDQVGCRPTRVLDPTIEHASHVTPITFSSFSLLLFVLQTLRGSMCRRITLETYCDFIILEHYARSNFDVVPRNLVSR